MARWILAALLLGCSSPATEPPSSATDSGVDAPMEAAAPTLTWASCNTGFECATFEPEAGIQLPVMRQRATGARLGAVVFNPGGPGNGVVADFPRTVKAFATLFGAEVMSRFDFVGIDFRGTGGSAPKIDCGDTATLDALFDADIGPTRPNPPELETASDKLATACKSDLAVDSITAAKDTEKLRLALGDEKISFLGISYGTRIGATYAALFPNHVRAFVLDSCLAPHGDQRETARDWARGTEAALDDFFGWCESTDKCGLKAAMSAATAKDGFDALMAKLDAAPLAVGARRLTHVRAIAAARNLLMQAEYLRLDRALSAAAEGNGADLLTFSDFANGRLGAGGYDGVFATRMAIRVSDAPYPEAFTKEQYLAFRGDLAKEFPRAGFAAAPYDIIAIKSGVPRALLPKVTTTAPPLLLVGGRHDAATIYDETTRLQTALNNGSFVLTHEGYGHGQIYKSACVAKAIGSFLVEPVAPAMKACDGPIP